MALWDGSGGMEIDRLLDANGIRHSPPTLGQTLGDPLCRGHTGGSLHYPGPDHPNPQLRCSGPRGSTGEARDYGITWPPPGSDCERIARFLEPYALGRNYLIAELLWTRRDGSGIWCDNGVHYVPGSVTRAGHRNHVHAGKRVGVHLPVGPGPAPVPAFPPKEIDMPIAYVENCQPGEQVVVAIPPIASDFWTAVFVSLSSHAGGTFVRFAIEPNARIVEENLAVPRGRKAVYPMRLGDEAVSIVNKGQQPVSILVEAR